MDGLIKSYPIKLHLGVDGKMLEAKEAGRFMHARASDHLMTPFQCELCHFQNILGQEILVEVHEDVELFEILQPAHLDEFWEQASLTASSNLNVGVPGEREASSNLSAGVLECLGKEPWATWESQV